jgi:hypothetical protein
MFWKTTMAAGLVVMIIGFAAVSRYLLPDIESRKQIITFWIIAICVEFVVKPKLGIRQSCALAVLSGVCATTAILLVRWHIKGLCPHTWPQCPDPAYAIWKAWSV